MKILELISIPTLTGAAEPMLNLCLRMKEQGALLDIHIDRFRPDNFLFKLESAGFHPKQDLWLSSVAPPHLTLLDIRGIVGIIRSGSYDVIHCHLSHDHVLATFARKLAGSRIPIVRSLHSSRSLSKRLLQSALWRRTDGVICHVEEYGRILSEKFSVPAENILILKNEVDLERFGLPNADERNLCRKRWDLPQDKIVIGYVSRIKPGRKHLDLLEAFARSTAREKVVLLLVGDGEGKKSVKAKVDELGLGGSVFFTGFLDEDLPQAYHAMNAYLQLAVGNDASCRAVLEAFACGLPAWGVSEAGIKESVGAWQESNLLSDSSSDSIASALEDMASRGDLPGLGLTGRSDVEEHYSGKGNGRAALDFMREISGKTT